MYMLVSFCQLGENLWEGWWCHPWSGDPGSYQKTGWVSHRGEAYKQHFSVVSVSISVLASSGEGL